MQLILKFIGKTVAKCGAQGLHHSRARTHARARARTQMIS